MTRFVLCQPSFQAIGHSCVKGAIGTKKDVDEVEFHHLNIKNVLLMRLDMNCASTSSA